MSRFFNTEGATFPAKHYCLPPLSRIDLPSIRDLIDREKYFVIHAPRQTGKTTCLLALRDHLNAEGKLFCVYANMEVAQGAREDLKVSMPLILHEIAGRAAKLGETTAVKILEAVKASSGVVWSIADFLSRWCQALKRPLVLLLDEVDSLVGDTLVMLLRHLRSGYDDRPARFPQSVILCGVRDVRDYRLRINGTKEVITGGSAFNIKAESLRLGDFTQKELEALYRQHTEETGQVFEPGALALAWELTRGQPWLVNALAHEVCFRTTPVRDRSRPVSAEMILAAKESLIDRRVTHLDQLADKLREARVQRVVETLLVGSEEPRDIPRDDMDYVEDLGLIRRRPTIEIANPIYREVIPRELTGSTQETISQEAAWYVLPDGRLDIEKLLGAFQEFFREHSEHWVERFDYKEAGPQLLLQAFLQRVVNGGGRIEREYGLGRGRTDLLVIWPWKGGVQRAVIEIKLLRPRDSAAKVLERGLTQTIEYQDRSGGASEAHLVIFDRDPTKPWAEKIYRRVEERGGRKIVVWGV
jgi:type II secretory pathway predicted ATPase ExeA